MTDEKKVSRIDRILLHCGVIDDETFVLHDEAILAMSVI